MNEFTSKFKTMTVKELVELLGVLLDEIENRNEYYEEEDTFED